MSKAIEVIEKYALVTPKQIHLFCDTSCPDHILEVQNALFSALQYDAKVVPDSSTSFDGGRNFMASSSVRGDRCCTYWKCRVQSVPFMARYAALYSDRFFLPISTEGIDTFSIAQTLKGSLLIISRLRPLIDRQLIVLGPDRVAMCREHAREDIPLFDLAEEAFDRFSRIACKDLEVFYDPNGESMDGQGVIEVYGPPSYLQSGGTFFDARDIVTLLPKSARTASSKIRLSHRTVLSTKLLERVLDDSLEDFKLQQYYGVAHNTRYLSNLEAEVDFLDQFKSRSEEDEFGEIGRMCTALSHEIPMFDNLTLAAVIRLREQEGEAFELYRDALAAIIRKYLEKKSTLTQKDYKEIYSVELLPKLHELQNIARSQKKESISKGRRALLPSIALISMGVIGGNLPHSIPQLLELIGGVHLLDKLSGVLDEMLTTPEKVRNHELYFLYKMKQLGRA